jgi:uncharacterized membrane protein
VPEPLDPEDGPSADPHTPPIVEKRRYQRGAASSRAMRAIKAAHAAERSLLERFADALTRVASSAWFFTLHVLWFALWIGYNTGLFGGTPFDAFPFGLLTMVVSLEAIFLSTFVLMTQGREAAIAELREELTLQVNLRIEQEVTKTLQLVAGLYTRLGHRLGEDPELAEMLRPLEPERIERELHEQIRAAVSRRRQG